MLGDDDKQGWLGNAFERFEDGEILPAGVSAEEEAPKAFELDFDQSDAAYVLEHCRIGVITGGPGRGKCLGPEVEVLLYDGSVKRADQVQVGDELMGPDSKPRRVQSVCTGTAPMYRIEPVKGRAWTCNDEHVLTVVRSGTDAVRDVPVNVFLAEPKKTRDRSKLFAVEVEWSETQLLPLDPWFVGVWFGDGDKRLSTTEITTADSEVLHSLAALAEDFNVELVLKRDRRRRCLFKCRLTGTAGALNPITSVLRELWSEDSLPRSYLLAGRLERLQFLAGLLDADGSYSKDGIFDFITCNEGWARDVSFLARSLGFRVNEAVKPGRGVYADRSYYRLCISGDLDRIPTRVIRKRARRRRQRKNPLRTGFVVRPIGEGVYRGWTLDGDGRFLLGDFVVTHNTRTLQAALPYLGRDVALCAPSGKAARRMAELTQHPAGTIHRLLGLQPERDTCTYHRGNPLPYDCVVVDEASTLDTFLCAKLLEACDPARTRVFFVGDVDQLPSVGPGQVLYDLIEADVVPVVRLKTMHRSAAESWVCRMAPEILEGRIDLMPTENFQLVEADDDLVDKTVQAAAYLCDQYGRDNVQVVVPMNVGDYGAKVLNLALQAAINYSDGPHFTGGGAKIHANDDVVVTANDYDKAVFNGETGRIINIDGTRGGLVLVDLGDREVSFTKTQASELLRLSYALTVHKMQGSEVAWVILALHEAHGPLLSRKLLYTAVTRARTGVIIVGQESAIFRAVSVADSTARQTTLQARLQQLRDEA